MSRTLQQLLRPLVPNVGLRIQHVEPPQRLEVRFREHLGLIARGAKAYEPRYVSLLKSLVNAGDTVWDIGANIGFYTVLFSTWVGRHGRVIAYEPDPANLKLLRRNLDLNACQNVVVRPVALSNESGSEVFSIDVVTRSTGHLGTGATYGGTIFGTGREDLISVVTSTLDEEVREFGPPNLIKMDIEGGEYDALAGGADLLQRHQPLIISELNAWTQAQPSGPGTAVQATRLLRELNYSLWDLDTTRPVEGDVIPWMCLAVPPGKHDEAQIAEWLSARER
ncbi:MAG: FkbM family methyltransferase [Pyrinomonadaceae bacterium]